MAKYYLPSDSINPDTIYGSGAVVCISEDEVSRLSREWGTDLLAQMREASRQDIRDYGTYDNLRAADTADIVAYINAFDEWDSDQFEALAELADRAGIDTDDYRDESGEMDGAHDLVAAIETALGVDLGA